MKPLDVVVIGNVGIDTNVYFQTPEIDFDVEANFTENLDCLGQAGGYAARGYARLGKRTGFIGHVGDDCGGRFIRETFDGDGIDTRGLFTDPAGTARSVNFMFPDGRRKNFYDGKGHLKLRPEPAICAELLAGTRLVHFNIPDWARTLLPVARSQGATVACDLQDLVSLDDAYRRDFIEGADILFFSSANHPDPSPIIRALLDGRPGRVVVCGMGALGCALGTADAIRFFPPAPFKAPVVDSNGAGDSLAVGFLCSYVLAGASLEDSVLKGQIAARHACTLRADSSNLIRPADLERHFRRLRRR